MLQTAKRCGRGCKKYLPIDQFLRGDREFKACERCRKLSTVRSLRWFRAHPEQAHARATRWRKENPEAAAAVRRRAQSRRRVEGLDHEYYLRNKPAILKRTIQWRERNRDKSRAIARRGYRKNDGAARSRERRKTDQQFLMMGRLRCRIMLALRAVKLGLRKADTTIRMLGCSYLELRAHIESQFTEGMTWEQVVSAAIHLDHIKACARFDLTDPDQQRECFHYSNLQPLWASDNLRKGAKMIA